MKHITHKTNIHAPWVGFELMISAGKRTQTYALDRAATGTGSVLLRIRNVSEKKNCIVDLETRVAPFQNLTVFNPYPANVEKMVSS